MILFAQSDWLSSTRVSTAAAILSHALRFKLKTHVSEQVSTLLLWWLRTFFIIEVLQIYTVVLLASASII